MNVLPLIVNGLPYGRRESSVLPGQGYEGGEGFGTYELIVGLLTGYGELVLLEDGGIVTEIVPGVVITDVPGVVVNTVTLVDSGGV